MKRIVLTLTLMVSSVMMKAQISNIGGNVGIGTSSPAQKLDVNGHVKFDALASTHTNIQLGHDVNDRIFADNSTAKSYGGGYFFRVTPDPSLNIAHNYIDVMMLTDKGNVGIGTETPKDRLDVNGSIVVKNGHNLSWGNKYGAGIPTIAANIGSGIYFYPNGSTSGATMKIDKKGNVDIGTQTSGVKLEVKGYMKLNTGTSDLLLYRDNDVGNWSLLRSNTGEGIAIIGQPDRVALSVSRNTSNVGIGTKDTKGFKLGVNGKIAATEVKVATYTNWPDFVFKKEYNLPTLNQVENQIKEEGHLEGIPNAAEVKKEGFFLGGMDAKLLQKIEELTLYAIEQEKEIEKLKTQKSLVEEIKKENKILKQRLIRLEELVNKLSER